jgi:anti-sigma factor RsiW
LNCRAVRENIGRYFDGQLPLSESSPLEAHLKQCRACARELAELSGVEALVRTIAVPPPPPELARSIIRRAATAGAGQATAWAWLEPLKAWPQVMRFAATGSALLAVYLGLLVSGGRGPQPPVGDVEWLRSASVGPVVAAYQGVSR